MCGGPHSLSSSKRFWQGWLATTVVLQWWWHVMTMVRYMINLFSPTSSIKEPELRLWWGSLKQMLRGGATFLCFFFPDESCTAVGPFSATEMWSQFMPPRQHSGGPAPDSWNGGRNLCSESNRPTGSDSLRSSFSTCSRFFLEDLTFPYCNSCNTCWNPIRPKVRAMDSMDSEETEFSELEQDEAKLAHEDVVCV